MNHEDFMRLALEQAKLAKSAGDLPFGAIVVQGDKVVGKNELKTIPSVKSRIM
ncbi:deaminase [Pedobacter sp.]|jgi:tRNA(adenine34) deaminase|uniref:deaminase n=1 Tax=Pedobacter sp. TaxID=1411316 RepID=UPI002BEBE1A6|nr:deaminase [Pedobacter sp.]HWW38686.1 deaminase [Pedobacter sp.]